MRPSYLLFAAALAACSRATTSSTSQLSQAELLARARGLHERIITIDTHDDIR